MGITIKKGKRFFALAAVLMTLHAFGQSSPDAEVLKLSDDIFKWEVNGNIDSLKTIMADKFLVVSSSGETQNKEAYLARLSGGNFTHKKIDIEQHLSTVASNTATVIGKGIFVVAVADKESTLHLSFMEVFTRQGVQQTWQLLAIYANRLPS